MPAPSFPDVAPTLHRAASPGLPPVIAIGGSAGAVEALRVLVEGLPADLGAAVLVVVHQPRHARSGLQGVLQAVTRLPVAVAADGERPRPGHVYVATPDRHLVLRDGVLRLTSAPRECHVRPAINVLFRSVALAAGSRAAGAVLSGALDDGTAGLWAIKDHGGTAYVQDPEEAEHPSMPRSAIEHVVVDGIHRVEALARALATWAAQADRAAMPATSAHDALHRFEVAVAAGDKRNAAQLFALANPSRFTCPECHGALAEIREGSIVRFRCHTGHAYSLPALREQLGVRAEEQLWSAMRAMEEQQMLLAWAQTHAPGNDQPPNAAAVTQAVDDLRVLAQSQAATGAAPAPAAREAAMPGRSGRPLMEWQEALGQAKAAALRIEALEAAAERRFDQAGKAGPDADSGAADALRRRELDAWLAARRATDAAWDRWAGLVDSRP